MDKLVALAKAFGVTTDQLLSPEEPEAETPPPPPPPPEPPYYHRRGVGGLVWLIRRYGWLAGVYIALSGAGITLVGGLARYSFLNMVQNMLGDSFFGSPGWNRAAQTPLIVATAILAVGLVILAAGIILAVVLYRKGRKGD